MKTQLSLVIAATLFLSCAGEVGRQAANIPGWSSESGGTLIQEASQARFPPRYGELIRGHHQNYDSAGHNGSVSYDKSNPHLRVTIYVYPIRHGNYDPSEEFREAVEDAVQATGGTVDSYQPLSIRRESQAVDGYLASLTWVRSGESIVSWVGLVPSNNWYYKVHATTSMENDGAAQSASAAVTILQDVLFGAR